MNDKCDECGADLINTPSGQFSTCPKGHGKLKPPVMPKPFDTVEVPESIAVCPECEGQLVAECCEWSMADGVSKATRGGLHIYCSTHSLIESDGHRYAQCDWIPVHMQIYEWLGAIE